MSDEFDRRDWAEDLNTGVRNSNTWFRGIKILVLFLFLVAVRIVVAVIALFQFLHCLFRNRRNEFVVQVGPWLAAYAEKTILFVTWSSDRAPFPFAPLRDVFDAEPDYGEREAEFSEDNWQEDYADQRDADEPTASPTPPEEPGNEPDQPDSGEGDTGEEESGGEQDDDEEGKSGAPPRPDA